MPERDYAGTALQYTHDVVTNRVAACKWTVGTYLRQLDDLARAGTDEFPFRYEPERGARVCTMLELLPHIKGRWKTSTITLEPWQIAKEMILWSWVHDRGHLEGLRRFRTDYEEVPRKNAKSTISAGRGLYMLAPDGEQGAECYSSATTRDQARIVWDMSKAMAKRTPGYCRRFGVQVMAHSLVAEESESFFKALSAEDDSHDGLNPHFANIDELHAHKNRGVWDVLETATGSREQSLLSSITTAGSNRLGICYEVRTYLTKILNAVLLRHPDVCEARRYKIEGGSADDETFFGVIYTIDDDDEWTDPASWAKANPNLGVSVKFDDIERLCRKAQQTPSAQPNFKTKRLNVWVDADAAWMDMLKWDKAADAAISLDQFTSEECFVGVCMTEVADIAPIVYVFSRTIDETVGSDLLPRRHYYAFGRFFVPEDTIEDPENTRYGEWDEAGRLVATSGNVTDQNAMQDEIRDAMKKFAIREVAFDPMQALKFSTELLDAGVPMVEYRATTQNYSSPMKEIEAAVRSGHFHHDGDPVFRWIISNVTCSVDRRDNWYPTKQMPSNKIDGARALIAAMGRAMHAPAPAPPPSIHVIDDAPQSENSSIRPFAYEDDEEWPI